jgi:MoxR-like ATPase
MTTISDVHALAERIRAGLDQVIIGQARAKEQVLSCLFAGGHALLEGAPGTAKTLMALSLSRMLGCTFRRIQFTPDLMPVDLLGTNIFNQKIADFTFIPGPVFTDVLLADEINRTPPRTQAALLEAMQERSVTIDGQRRDLSAAFFVMATQNPIEFEGTYPLPEAQKDRFLARIQISFPEPEEEVSILRSYSQGRSLHEVALRELQAVTDVAGVVAARTVVASQVRVEDKLLSYIRDVVAATRTHDQLSLGAGPRAGLALLNLARSQAVLRDRDFITPDDLKELAHPVLAHRLNLTPEAEMEGVVMDDVLQSIFTRIEVPR